jgi:toxin ParE1/3/4
MPKWTLNASNDAHEAWDRLATDNEAAADRILDLIVSAANRLDRFPLLGRPGPFPGTRQFFVPRTPFKLIYRIIPDGEIELLRVYHTSRDWPP